MLEKSIQNFIVFISFQVLGLLCKMRCFLLVMHDVTSTVYVMSHGVIKDTILHLSINQEASTKFFAGKKGN